MEEVRGRARSKIEQLRGRVMTRGGGGFLSQRSQVMVGKGALVEQARRRANQVSRRLMERKPGIIPMVKEFKPGQRVRQLFGQITDNPAIDDMAVMGVRADPALSVHWE